MIVEKTKMNQIDELVNISKAAFDSDIEVGAETKGGPPDYDNVSWHIQMMKKEHLLSAFEDGKLVGGAVIFINDKKELFIGRIFIAPEYYGKGYGIMLMKEIEKKYSNCTAIFLDTPIWNIRTNRFYRKLGYIEIRRDEEFIFYKKIKEQK